MTAAGERSIVVTGATGLQDSAVTRHLLNDGWHVRALTRNAASKRIGEAIKGGARPDGRHGSERRA